MRKNYVKPTLITEVFNSSNYIAACYVIYCVLPNNNAKGNVYFESNGIAGLQTGSNSDRLIGQGVTGCGAAHKGVQLDEAPTNNSYWKSSRTGEVQAVFSWSDNHGWHSAPTSTTNWETNPNAS